jgi:xylose isomerase
MEQFHKIGIGYWCTHDTDVIATNDIGTARQDATVDRIKVALKKNGLKCSMVTTETFHHAV